MSKFTTGLAKAGLCALAVYTGYVAYKKITGKDEEDEFVDAGYNYDTGSTPLTFSDRVKNAAKRQLDKLN